MNLQQEFGGASHYISHYSAEGIRIGQRLIRQSCIVMPERLVLDWPAPKIAELRLDDFSELWSAQLEILLLGTGASQRFPKPALLAEFSQAGYGLEVMTTAAACRTYNILISENRKVAAALILDQQAG